jgi:N-alpha-acetyl-L-2,4-diaminobutyrate deacetylase
VNKLDEQHKKLYSFRVIVIDRFLSNIFKIQNVECPVGEKVNDYLTVHEITLVNGVGEGPILLINGGEHGSEYNGPAGCLKLIDTIDPNKINGKVILVPMVNTLAFEYRWMHGNPADYRDLTSCYVDEVPKGGSGPPKHSYQLAVTFYKEIISKAKYRLNLHGGDIEEDLLTGTMYTRIGDETRDNSNLAMARDFGWEWIRESIRRPQLNAPPRPQRYMPMTVGTEAGGMGRCQSDLSEMVLKGCNNTLKHLKMMDGKIDKPKNAKVFNPYHIYCSRGGLFISHVRAGDLIKEKDVLGEIRNLNGKIVEEIIAPTDGIIHMVTSPALWEGDVTYEIGKDIREIE